MTTQYNNKNNRRFGVGGLNPSTNLAVTPSKDDITIPSVGIEDVDIALFNLFDKELTFQISSDNETKNVPVIFASGEKYALLKRGRALKDKNGTLILPLITITRTSIDQSDTTGRGINQQTGDIIIRRKLDKSDRQYQNLINRLFIKNQQNLAVNNTDNDQLTTEREVGDLSEDIITEEGGLLFNNRKHNVYETITVPSPQFFIATYQITFWTQYTQHMNQLLQNLMESFLPQGQSWRLDTQKGYWFIATVDASSYTTEQNFDDMSSTERIIKHTFNVTVPAYMFASQIPGEQILLKRYISTPTLSFNVGVNSVAESEGTDAATNMFLGSDDPTLPMSTDKNGRLDQRETNGTRLFDDNSDDPALRNNRSKYKKITGIDSSGKKVTKYVKITSTNKHTGETTFSSDFDFSGLKIIITDD